MACNTCSSKTGTPDQSVEWASGTFAAGAQMSLRNSIRTLNVAGFKVPNIIQFSEDPSLASGDKLFLSDYSRVSTIRGIVKNVAVTGAGSLVLGLYEVPTDLTLAGVNGVTVASVLNSASNAFCLDIPQKSVTVDLLAAPATLANFSGYIFSRPLNSLSTSGCVTVVNGSDKITIKDSSFVIKKGDKISIEQTAVTAGTVIDVSTGRNSAGERVSIVQLLAPVTGVTAIAVPGQLPQVIATVRPQSITPIVFTAVGDYEILATVPAAVTSSPNFATGQRVDSGDCDGQKYCYVMNVQFPGSDIRSLYGSLILR